MKNEPVINFFNVVCIEFMKSKPDKCYDLAIVDPPYGLGLSIVNSGGRFKRYYNKNGNWDMNTPTLEYFKQLFRISKNQIIWGGNYFELPTNRCFIIWDKLQPEGISFSMCEYAWASFDKVAQIYKKRTQDQARRFHPTQKPIDLYRWILQNYTNQNDKILDTHGGSMTIAIACEIEGFDLDICEIDPDYFRDGLKAFEIHKQQQRLF